jgi:hypothetical protein
VGFACRLFVVTIELPQAVMKALHITGVPTASATGPFVEESVAVLLKAGELSILEGI